MMTLAQASSYFDRTEATDPDNGSVLFRCQVDPFEETKRDSYSAYRRVMSVAPGIGPPTQVSLLGSTWLVGHGEPDGQQSLHRKKFVLSPVTDTLNVGTLAQYLAGTPAAQVRAAAYWAKDVKQVDVSSDQPQMFDVFVPLGTAAEAYTVLWNASKAFMCLSPRPEPSGLLDAYSLKLQELPGQATVNTRVFSPILGSYGPEVGTQVPALRVRWQSLFEYGAQLDARYQEGDVSLVIPSGLPVSSSSTVRFGGRVYSVLSSRYESGALVLHARAQA